MLAALFMTVLAQTPAKIEVGKPIPDVAIQDMNGKTVRLSQFRGKKLILFNWASW
ncbi:MAG: redoxin domain-containing protein [Fimbriimonadaceae bacterium]|nr:redoxin domain-containing protein [Fimbriimonadaceae bacterium]